MSDLEGVDEIAARHPLLELGDEPVGQLVGDMRGHAERAPLRIRLAGDDLVERLLEFRIGEKRADFASEGHLARLDEIERLAGADRFGDMAEAFRERERGRILAGEKTFRHLAHEARADRRAALDLVAREAEDGGVEAAGKRERIAHRAVEGRRARFEAFEEIAQGAPVRHLGVSLAGVQAAMVVGRGEEDFAVRIGMRRFEVVTIGQLADFFRRQGGKTAVAYFLGQRFAIAVAGLEAAEEQHEALEMLDGEKLVDVDQRMRNAVGQFLLAQIAGEFVRCWAAGSGFPRAAPR